MKKIISFLALSFFALTQPLLATGVSKCDVLDFFHKYKATLVTQETFLTPRGAHRFASLEHSPDSKFDDLPSYVDDKNHYVLLSWQKGETKDQDSFELIDPSFKPIKLLGSKFYGKFYRIEEAKQKIAPGTWVQLNVNAVSAIPEPDRQAILKALNTFETTSFPALALETSEETAKVMVLFNRNRHIFELNRTLINKVHGGIGSLDHFLGHLKNTSKFVPQTGQTVAIRNQHDEIQSGELVSKHFGRFYVRLTKNSQKAKPFQEIFPFEGSKFNHIKPKEYSVKAGGLDVEMGADSKYASFLDAVGRYRATKIYQSYDTKTKVKVLAKFIANLLPWSDSGILAEQFGIQSKGDVVCSGIAVCRHSNIVLADVLREAGFDIDIKYASTAAKNINPETTQDIASHLWLEAHLMVGSKLQTFVLDIAHRESAVYFKNIGALSNSMERQKTIKGFYLNPHRENF